MTSVLLPSFFLCVAGMPFQAGPDYADPAHWKAAADYNRACGGASMLVMIDGKVVFEDYPAARVKTQGYELASGTKSFAGVAGAFAVKEGKFRWNDPVSRFITEWKSDPVKVKITVSELLHLVSGVKGTIGAAPTYADAIESNITTKRGEKFQYGAAPFQIYGELFKRATGQTVPEYLQPRLFDPLGIAPSRWRNGRDGNPLIPQGSWFTAQNWAKFGEFIRLGGIANGKRLIDQNALDVLFEGSTANPCYGLSWWLHRPISDAQRAQIPLLGGTNRIENNDPAVPKDMVYAAGAGHQMLFVSRSAKFVIVRQSTSIIDRNRREGNSFTNAEFLNLLAFGRGR
jgi:CubicO group peptidase (beta-lactamase class C family)